MDSMMVELAVLLFAGGIAKSSSFELDDRSKSK